MSALSHWRKQLTFNKILFHALFQGLHIFIFALGWWAQVNNTRLETLNVLSFSVWISRGAALCLTIDGAVILLPMCRNLMTFIRPRLRFLPLDEAQYFHRHVAYSMLFWTCLHVGSHYVNFFNIERTQIRRKAAVQLHYTQPGGITGHVMLLCMMLIYTSSHARIRQQSFELFHYVHHVYILFILALLSHATGCFVRDSLEPYSPFAGQVFWQHCIGYQAWRWELVGAAVYLAERVYREVRARRKTTIFKVIKHPYDVVEIQLRKPSMAYKAGQYLFLSCPSISSTQWHPFTITSCPYDPYISVHIRIAGDFTCALASALGAGPAQASLYDDLETLGMYEVALSHGQALPTLRIDGPYGAPAEDVFDNEVAVLVGTGIGVTPWASVLKGIWHLRRLGRTGRLRRVEFVWVCRETSSFEWFQALLASLEAQSEAEATAHACAEGEGKNGSGEFLRIHTYLTQRLDVDAATNIVLHSVGTARDPLTGLGSRTNFGRPDFGKLLRGLRDGIVAEAAAAEGEPTKQTDVGVYFCGPNAAGRDVKRACRAMTGRRVRFKFWKEHF